MDFAFRPPILMLVIFGAIVLAAVPAILLKKMPRGRKMPGIAVTLAVCGALTFFLYRTTHVVVDDQGIRADTYGRQSIPWISVQKVALVEPLASSPYALVMKTSGISLGDLRKGWFNLSNGATAFVTTEIPDRALVIEAQGKTFIFGPRDFDAFVAEVGRHVTIERESGGVS